MSLEKVDALVVKSVDYSESSLILNVFTREMGKVRGIAKGARRLKNPFETSLDLLASIRLSFIRKNSDALDLFTEAKLRRRFRPTQRNFRGLYAAYYVAETPDFATQDYEPFPDLWTLADATLERLQEGGNVAARLAYYEAGLLKSAGEFPSVRACFTAPKVSASSRCEGKASNSLQARYSGSMRRCTSTSPSRRA